MEILNAAWVAEIYRLVKARISSMDNSLAKGKEDPSRNLKETESEYIWNNHMGTPKYYSKPGLAGLKEFVNMYDNGLLKDPEWENRITNDMWREIALAMYYCDVKMVCAGISFPDARDYVFRKMLA